MPVPRANNRRERPEARAVPKPRQRQDSEDRIMGYKIIIPMILYSMILSLPDGSPGTRLRWASPGDGRSVPRKRRACWVAAISQQCCRLTPSFHRCLTCLDCGLRQAWEKGESLWSRDPRAAWCLR